MAGGKRRLASQKAPSKEEVIEDKQTPFQDINSKTTGSDDSDEGDSTDSSVYSDLEGKILVD